MGRRVSAAHENSLDLLHIGAPVYLGVRDAMDNEQVERKLREHVQRRNQKPRRERSAEVAREQLARRRRQHKGREGKRKGCAAAGGKRARRDRPRALRHLERLALLACGGPT